MKMKPSNLIEFDDGLLKKYKGGFSKEVTESFNFKEYTLEKDGHPKKAICGYIGCLERTKKRDKIVEEHLRKQGLGDEGIACWLTSTAGRHLMDNVYRKTSLEMFAKIVFESTKDAFINITVWNHPDHEGSWDSTQKLKQKLFNALIVEGFEQYLQRR